MKGYVQSNKNKIPYSVNGYVAMTGFEQMGFEIVLFEDLDNVIPEMNREDIVVGGIETVRKRLAQLGIALRKLTTPRQFANT